MSLTATELLQAVGIGRTALSRYLAAGCPHDRLGPGERAPLRFELAAVRAWMHKTARTGDQGSNVGPAHISVAIEEGTPPAPAPEREEGEEEAAQGTASELVDLVRRVNIEIKRLEVKRRRRLEAEAAGELVPLEDVRRAWLAQIEVVQARFRSLPSVLAPRLVGKDYDAIRDAIEAELRTVLLSFARKELDLA